MGFPVELEEGVYLIRHMPALDLIETQQPVICRVTGKVGFGLCELLHIAENTEGLGRLFEPHVGAPGDHQAVGLLLARGLHRATAENLDDLAVFLLLK